MRVLIHSRVFLPSLGGLENMMHLIATELSFSGHAVTVLTMTEAQQENNVRYRVIRRPNLTTLISEALRADVCLVANITLRTTPMLLLLGRKVVTVHHGWYEDRSAFDLSAKLKRILSYLTYNIFCSAGVRRRIGGHGIVIPNAYSDQIFRGHDDVPRDRDIVFLGRLVTDKGCNILLEAVGLLRARARETNLTIVGDGPELPRLKHQVDALGLAGRVTFAGKVEGEALARLLARHRILAIPSVWEEPFGIVALEGAACGCVVLGTDGGGLPEAIGPSGIVVSRSDPDALADAIERVIADPVLEEGFRTAALPHLTRHTRSVVGRQYNVALARVAGGLPLDAETWEG